MRIRTLLLMTAFAAGCSKPATRPATDTPVLDVRSEDAYVVSVVYQERLRHGLGSPFRLIDEVLHDERLGVYRTYVARELLSQIKRGDLYVIDARSFMAAGEPRANAAAHLLLIEQSIGAAGDPAIGELAINRAYERAASEGVVSREFAARAARVAALLLDRAHAMRDAARVGDVADVPQWRRERRFTVEVPTLNTLSPAARDEAERRAQLLIGGVRAAAMPVSSALLRDVPEAMHMELRYAQLVAEDTAARVPQGAIVNTLRAIRSGISSERARVAAPHWQHFFEHAVDAESVIAEIALARRDAADDIVAAGLLLDVATALRPFAQEPVVLPAMSADSLKARFGVRVRFAASISSDERARTLGVLSYALEDLRSVLRSMDLSGLAFEIAPIRADAGHLAFHESKRRVIRFDPSTMAGTIAHEIGHDLDWQLARAKYRTRNSYATDYATRTSRSLAYMVENLNQDHSRPAEVFARGFEWYVAASLAARGRSNGYLTSLQNEWNVGYGAAQRPAGPYAAKSFAALLAEAAGLDRAAQSRVEALVNGNDCNVLFARDGGMSLGLRLCTAE